MYLGQSSCCWNKISCPIGNTSFLSKCVSWNWYLNVARFPCRNELMHIFVLSRKVILVLFTKKPIILSSGHFQYMDIDHTDHCKHWTCNFLTIPRYSIIRCIDGFSDPLLLYTFILCMSDVSMVSPIPYSCIHSYLV